MKRKTKKEKPNLTSHPMLLQHLQHHGHLQTPQTQTLADVEQPRPYVCGQND